MPGSREKVGDTSNWSGLGITYFITHVSFLIPAQAITN